MVTPSVEIRHRTVEANGIAFHVAESGQPGSPQVLLLHGIPEGSETWGPIMNHLPGLHLFAPDLRAYPGTGRPEGSPRRLGAYVPLTLSDDIKALIEELGLDRPMLVAHDIGGGLAWIFAHRYSELIRKLVIVNCTHTRTLARAIVRCQDLQPFRIPWLPVFSSAVAAREATHDEARPALPAVVRSRPGGPEGCHQPSSRGHPGRPVQDPVRPGRPDQLVSGDIRQFRVTAPDSRRCTTSTRRPSRRP